MHLKLIVLVLSDIFPGEIQLGIFFVPRYCHTQVITEFQVMILIPELVTSHFQ